MKTQNFLTGLFMTAAFYPASSALPADGNTWDSARQTVETVCRAKKPVLVFDIFAMRPTPTSPFSQSRPTHDFDGDGIPDGAHGDYVAAIYEAAGKKVMPFNIPARLRNSDDIITVYRTLAERLENGTIARPAAINISAGTILYFRELIENLPAARDAITATERGERGRQALAFILNDTSEYAAYYRDLYAVFQRLQALGIPVIAAAGNDDCTEADAVNVLSLMPGVVTVGALDYKGKIASYSCESSLVSVHSTGEFFARAVEGGIDINGDGTPEFPAGKLSGGETIAKYYAGRKLKNVLVKPPPPYEKNPYFFTQMMRTGQLPEGIYPTDKIVRGGYTEGKGTYTHYPSFTDFTVTPDGVLKFDPAGDGDPKKVLRLPPGTSFAAPHICTQAEP
jgi:hypothetical protein